MAASHPVGNDESVVTRGVLSRPALWFGLSAAMLLVGCAYTILFCASTRDISAHAQGTDDAYISYLYAKNLVSGHGLVFNPGEHVEGYSNPLYVLLMTIPFLLGG